MPTLIINSYDDPFLDAKTFPMTENVSKEVELEYHKKGGHSAFIASDGWKIFSWIDIRVSEFFSKQLETFNLG